MISRFRIVHGTVKVVQVLVAQMFDFDEVELTSGLQAFVNDRQ